MRTLLSVCIFAISCPARCRDSYAKIKMDVREYGRGWADKICGGIGSETLFGEFVHRGTETVRASSDCDRRAVGFVICWYVASLWLGLVATRFCGTGIDRM